MVGKTWAGVGWEKRFVRRIVWLSGQLDSWPDPQGHEARHGRGLFQQAAVDQRNFPGRVEGIRQSLAPGLSTYTRWWNRIFLVCLFSWLRFTFGRDVSASSWTVPDVEKGNNHGCTPRFAFFTGALRHLQLHSDAGLVSITDFVQESAVECMTHSPVMLIPSSVHWETMTGPITSLIKVEFYYYREVVELSRFSNTALQ